MNYCWDKGRWLGDGHLWMLLLDIPKLPREDTGERVVLQTPPWIFYGGVKDVPPVECAIYFVPKANLYIAVGEKVNGYLDVLFFDKNTLQAERSRRFPQWPLADE